MKKLLATIIALFTLTSVFADCIDSLESVLREKPQIQEKVYIHTDNNCYFVGDTIWYKAYVLRSDNLHPTNLSRLLYVELLSPDGIVVERQHIVIADGGATCGQFELKDSLYSGYYEIRAYTRYQLNFNVAEKFHTIFDERKFYSKQMAKDFFRDFEGLYSRVIPVYTPPREEGEYDERYMYSRPKTRILKEHMTLNCQFYPEGGHLVQGVKSRVAFELFDQNGMNLDLDGTLSKSGKIQTSHMGRGNFMCIPGEDEKVSFQWNDKIWTFNLPKPEKQGTVLNYDAEAHSVTIESRGVRPAAMAVLCRGIVMQFNRLDGTQKIVQTLPYESLATGINEIIVFDENAQPLASRLFFVNHQDMGGEIDVTLSYNTGEVTSATTLKPFEHVGLGVVATSTTSLPKSVSVAVYDRRTDDPTYNDGNILTDMLLSGDLKGFVACPAYYFEKDDAEHRARLDLLLQVQGWRKYKRIDKGQYLPETGLTFEGQVLKLPSNVSIPDIEDVTASMASGADEDIEARLNALAPSFEEESEETEEEPAEEPEVEYATESENDILSYGRLRRPVIVEAELVKDTEVAGVTVRTDNSGRFSFQLPPFYDQAVLRVKAYNVADSVKKNMMAVDKNMFDDRAYPDFYVKRDMFFPIYSQPYSWYQVNMPDVRFIDEDDELIPENSRLAGDHVLQTVIVKAKRRGKRAVDYSKPAFVRDAYQLYNEVTDYGLSFGVYNSLRFPRQAATFLYGNMGRANQFNIRAMLDNTSFYRNYKPLAGVEYDRNMSSALMEKSLHLDRLLNVRAFTDYELRTDSGDVVATNSPDVILVFENVPDDGKRYTYRDRRYILDGITYAEEFYRRDYSNSKPTDPKDYRRTLYWNPNAKLDNEGRFTDEFFNNARETRVTISATAVSPDGKLFHETKR